MFVCSKCHLNFKNSAEFLTHIRSHQSLANFECSKECGSFYSSYDSLRKHILRKHAPKDFCIDQSNLNTSNLVEVIDYPSIYPDLEQIDVSTSSEPCTKKIYNCNASNSLTENSGIKSSSLENNNLVDRVKLFNAKVYDYKDLSRKRSNVIIQDTRKLIENFTSEMKEKVLQSALKMNNSDLTRDINYIFDDVNNATNNLSSEHRIINTFKKSNTYIEPQKF